MSKNYSLAWRDQAGFSLIELMVAMALSLIVLGAAIAVFQSNQRSYGSNEGLNRVQEGARVAYEMISRDIRAAGASACTNEGRILGADANSVAFRSPLSGSATEVTTVAAEDQSYRVSAATVNSATLVAVTGFTPSDVFEAGDAIMVCNGAMAGFTTVASVSGQVVSFGTALEFDPSNTEGAAAGSISLATFRNARWTVESNSRTTGSSLYVRRNGGAAQEVADGVQNLAFTYHQFSGGNSATYVAAPSDFSYVDAARISFSVRAQAPQEVGGTAGWITRNGATTVGVRNRTL